MAMDTDNEISTLKRFHPNATFIDLDESRQLDATFAATEQADLLVVETVRDLLTPSPGGSRG